jgi:parallel beta-helix repeat protein
MKRASQWCCGLILAVAAVPASAETTECTVIGSVPVTITEQGVYCLKGNLATSIPTGAAILVATNNVSIDFNRYKLGGQSAGIGTNAIGVQAVNRLNVQIFNGVIRGFRRGIALSQGSGHLVEDMIVDGNTEEGIVLTNTTGALVRRNQVLNTGGTTYAQEVTGIHADGGEQVRVIDNDVSGTSLNAGGTSSAYGIQVTSHATIVEGNRVTATATYGIYSSNNQNVSIADNRVHNLPGAPGSIGIRTNGSAAICRNNDVQAFTTPFSGCNLEIGNVPTP